MELSENRYAVYASYFFREPESPPEDYTLEERTWVFTRLTKAVDLAQELACEPANPGEWLQIGIYQLIEVVKDEPIPAVE